MKYVRMFDMTNDSHRFRTGAELLDAEGFYPVQGQPLEEGERRCTCRLYEGKMVQAFDHRAASVVVNPKNLNRPASPTAGSYHRRTFGNPDWLARSSVLGSRI